MKKLVIASMISLAATSVSAVELGIVGARDFAGTDRNAAGLTLGQKVGPVTLTAGVDRTTVGIAQNRWTLVAGYDLFKVGTMSVAVKGGVAYLDNATGEDGAALVAGVGAAVPLTKSVSATVDYTRQYGQDRVTAFDGNRVTAGLKYSF